MTTVAKTRLRGVGRGEYVLFLGVATQFQRKHHKAKTIDHRMIKVYIFGKLSLQAFQKHHSLKVPDVELLPWIFLARKLYQNSVTAIKLLTSIQAKFETITPKDVEEVAFLAKAVCRKRFQIKEAITFDSYHLCLSKACDQSDTPLKSSKYAKY